MIKSVKLAGLMAVCALGGHLASYPSAPGHGVPDDARVKSSIDRDWPLVHVPGKLMLGGGTFIDAMGDEFVKLSGGPNARLVIIPTAYGPCEEEGLDQFVVEWSKYKPGSVDVLHTRDRNIANDPAFAALLDQATGVWLTGGNQVRLLETYENTLVHEGLKKVLARGGAVGGNCAGAMVLGEWMIVSGKEPAILRPGLALAPDVIVDSHWLERNRIQRLRHLIEAGTDRVGFGVDSATAVVLDAGRMRVVGNSYVTTVLPSENVGEVRFDMWQADDDEELDYVLDFDAE